VVPGFRSWWFELSQYDSLHRVAIEKQAQRKRRMFSLKHNIVLCVFKSPNFSCLSLPQKL
jgi:hypothetical protein